MKTEYAHQNDAGFRQGKYIRWLALLAFLAVQVGWVAAVVAANKGTDFYVYYLAAEALKRGRNIYELDFYTWQSLATQMGVPHYSFPYLYPPLIALIIRPFTLLSPRHAFAVWSGGNVLLLLASALLLSRLVARQWISPLVFIALAGYVPALTTVYAGQVNILVLLSVIAYLYALQREKPVCAGLALAAGILVKPIPLPLAFHGLWKARYRVFFSVLVGLIVLALLILPGVGPEPYMAYGRLSLQISGLAQLGSPSTYPPNQGLGGFFGRLLTHHEYGSSLADHPALARALTLATSLILVLATAVLCWPGRVSEDLFVLEVSLVLITTHLIAPFSWFHHMTVAFVALIAAWQVASSRWERALVLLSYILIDLQGVLWHRLVGHSLLLSLGTYGLLILWGVLAWQTIRFRRGSRNDYLIERSAF